MAQLCFSPDSKQVAAAGPFSALYDTATQYERPLGGGPFEKMCFSPDGTLLVGGSLAGGIAVWETASARMVAEFAGQRAPQGVISLAISRDAKYIAAGNDFGGIQVVEYAAHREQLLQELLRKQFAEIDRDGDETLVRSEWMRWHSPSMTDCDPQTLIPKRFVKQFIWHLSNRQGEQPPQFVQRTETWTHEFTQQTHGD